MTEIKLADRYRDLVLSREKTQTIRKGRRDYPLNKVVLSFEESLDLNIIITEVTYKRFKYVTEEEAIADGFNSKSELFKALQEFYPDIDDETEVTLVKFKI